MGTNYYWYQGPPCPHCERNDKPLHIGKSSAGWCFALHIYPEDGINTYEDWRSKFNVVGSYIEDEYGKTVSVSEMLDIIIDRCSGSRNFSDMWLVMNHACTGPNNLVRSIVDGSHCVGHGKGTWDYFIGEFS